jgi:hypothetical protein
VNARVQGHRANGIADLGTPPHSVEAEQAVLGGLLLGERKSWDVVAELLKPDDFYRADHRIVFRAICALAGEGTPSDIVTVGEWLERANQVADAGGFHYVGQLARDTPGADNIRSYAEIVRKRALERRLQSAAADLDRAVGDENKIREALARARAIEEELSGATQSALPEPIWFEEARADLSRRDVVEELLGAGELSSAYGQSGCGKTFGVLDLSLSIARGVNWCGRHVMRSIVFYAAGEGSRSVLLRQAAYRLHHEVSGALPFAVIPASINLLNATKHIEAVMAMAKRAQRHWDLPLGLIVIDTLARSMAGGEENGSEHMGAAIRSADLLRERTGAHVLLIHHTGKADNGPRGWSGLRAALDTEIEFAGAEGVRTAKVTKQRDLPSGTTFAFTLKPVVIGTNPETGKDVTSCIVEHTEAPQTARRAPTAKNQAALLSGLKEFIRERPEAIITPAEVMQIAKAQGLKSHARLAEAREGLHKHGWIIDTIGGIRIAEDTL